MLLVSFLWSTQMSSFQSSIHQKFIRNAKSFFFLLIEIPHEVGFCTLWLILWTNIYQNIDRDSILGSAESFQLLTDLEPWLLHLFMKVTQTSTTSFPQMPKDTQESLISFCLNQITNYGLIHILHMQVLFRGNNCIWYVFWSVMLSPVKLPKYHYFLGGKSP